MGKCGNRESGVGGAEAFLHVWARLKEGKPVCWGGELRSEWMVCARQCAPEKQSCWACPMGPCSRVCVATNGHRLGFLPKQDLLGLSPPRGQSPI